MGNRLTRVYGIISAKITIRDVERRNPEILPSISAITMDIAEFIMAIMNRIITKT